MAKVRVICNTSPIIELLTINRLELLEKLLLGSEGGCCMEYKYRDKKETCHEKI